MPIEFSTFLDGCIRGSHFTSPRYISGKISKEEERKSWERTSNEGGVRRQSSAERGTGDIRWKSPTIRGTWQIFLLDCRRKHAVTGSRKKDGIFQRDKNLLRFQLEISAVHVFHKTFCSCRCSTPTFVSRWKIYIDATSIRQYVSLARKTLTFLIFNLSFIFIWQFQVLNLKEWLIISTILQ